MSSRENPNMSAEKHEDTNAVRPGTLRRGATTNMSAEKHEDTNAAAEGACPMSGFSRRGLFTRGLVAGGGAAVAALSVAAADPSAASAPTTMPFHGMHQNGILPAPAPASAHLAFDVTARNRTELAAMFAALTDRARILTAGGPPADLGVAAPATDDGTLGPTNPAGDLQVTVAVGSTLFDSRFGLAAHKPRRLRPMDTFVNDQLDPTRTGGDLLVTLTAQDRDTVTHAIRDICRSTRSNLQLRWRVDGFTPPPRPDGHPRNLLGFKDGIQGPDISNAAAMDQLIWVTPSTGEPTWAVGGTYQVVRLIRMHVEFWDRVSVSEQERMFGHRKDSGAPLSGGSEDTPPDYTNDAIGSTIPLDAHIRLANPRTPQTVDQQILRRSFSYDRGVDDVGNLDMGLVFGAFNQDLDRQFVTVQKRLANEPLVDYITPVGGGYFFALPGVQGPTDVYARALLA
ncbi:Dyp-type peroxidase [Rudaeicoccus suwonensis]|uniref:Deferrochelatase/peroxidase EfeB n=1 Tax=Rudaeicoccus suwonensis TaxID=657409 RepID=A0A561E132_9MICO|nr:Dyp-type peroxidase [Rudaeicoccus suwonensis]TWE09348.1 deferrochelatase/peroxidase EfeB [Rudaeicoccus suwonensis]